MEEVGNCDQALTLEYFDASSSQTSLPTKPVAPHTTTSKSFVPFAAMPLF